MASSELAKAKTLLTLALLRPDPKPCPPAEIETIASLIQTATNKCSAPNVQNCKKWALANLVPSERRVEPFCNYLVALANSFSGRTTGDSKPPTSEGARAASAARRRLHILYIINDIVHHVKFRLPPLQPGQTSFISKVEATLPLLVKSAATFIRRPKQIEKVRGLVSLWSERGYFSGAFLDSLRKAIDEGVAQAATGKLDTTAQDNSSSATSGPKPVPFNLPKRHGDLSTAWYDLTPGNWLPWVDGTYPLEPRKIAPMEFKPGPAREELVQVVTSIMADVKRIIAKEGQPDSPQFDMSEVGERLARGSDREITRGDTYYGWSRRFCGNSKDKEQGRVSRGRAPERSQSFSQSISRSTSAAHGRYQNRNESKASSGHPTFNRRRSPSIESSRSESYRRRSRSPAYSRSSSRGSDYRRARDPQTSQNRPRGGYGQGYNSYKGGTRPQSGGYDRSGSPQTHGYPQVPNVNSGFAAPHAGPNMFSQENRPPYNPQNPHMPFPNPNLNMQNMFHQYPAGFPHQGYGNFPGPSFAPNFQGPYSPAPPPSMPGTPGYGRGGYNGMGRGRGYYRGGRW